MTQTLSRSVRFMFATLVLTLTAYTLLESALGASPARADAMVAAPAPEGLSTCGTESAPCRLEAVTVQADAPEAHLASSGSAPRMTLRVRT